MIVSHTFQDSGASNFSVKDRELKHPDTVVTHTKLGPVQLLVYASLGGTTDKPLIRIAVTVGKIMHTVFAGTPEGAEEFFKSFPKECVIP